MYLIFMIFLYILQFNYFSRGVRDINKCRKRNRLSLVIQAFAGRRYVIYLLTQYLVIKVLNSIFSFGPRKSFLTMVFLLGGLGRGILNYLVMILRVFRVYFCPFPRQHMYKLLKNLCTILSCLIHITIFIIDIICFLPSNYLRFDAI